MAALPRTAVVKLSGKVLDDPAALAAIAADIGRGVAAGVRIVVVHGGGKQLDRLCARFGLTPVTVAGRRVTDAPTLAAAKMAFAGELLTDMLARLAAAGVKPVGLHGPACVHAVQRPPVTVDGRVVDYGHVGDVTAVDAALLELLLNAGYVPVVAPLAGDAAGNIYNVNADTIASEVAAAVKADLALFLSDVPGILRDVKDAGSLIPAVDGATIAELTRTGVLSGGMLPKVEAVQRVVARGVGAVCIASGFAPGVVARALGLEAGPQGTVITA